MPFYDDLIAGINASYGEGTPFRNYTALARYCGVSPTQMHRYINGQSNSSLMVIGKILDGIGAQIIFPDAFTPQHLGSAATESQSVSSRDELELSRQKINELTKLLQEKSKELLRAEGEILALEKQIERLMPSPPHGQEKKLQHLSNSDAV